jgi:hypothetical protein
MAVQTKSWKGIAPDNPFATKTTRARMPQTTPMTAHKSHAGKNAPNRVNEGAPLSPQPPRRAGVVKHNISRARVANGIASDDVVAVRCVRAGCRKFNLTPLTVNRRILTRSSAEIDIKSRGDKGGFDAIRVGDARFVQKIAHEIACFRPAVA